MKKCNLLKFNILLYVTLVLLVISMSMLNNNNHETLSFTSPAILFHAVVGVMYITLVTIHISIHWGGAANWFRKVLTINKKLTKILFYLFVLLVVSIFALIIVFAFTNSSIALKIHGKIGLALIIANLLHAVKYLKWFRGKNDNTSFVPTINHDKCVKCKKCVNNCPANILYLDKIKGRICITNANFCVQCKKCVRICPVKAID